MYPESNRVASAHSSACVRLSAGAREPSRPYRHASRPWRTPRTPEPYRHAPDLGARLNLVVTPRNLAHASRSLRRASDLVATRAGC
eukprot:5534321-Prymnesium_polylepis.1